MEFIGGRPFTKQRKQLLQSNDKLYEGMRLTTKNIRFSPEHRDHQANTQDDDGQVKASGQKRCLGVCGGDIGGRLYLQDIIFLHQLALLKDI